MDPSGRVVEEAAGEMLSHVIFEVTTLAEYCNRGNIISKDSFDGVMFRRGLHGLSREAYYDDSIDIGARACS